jgi:outer membrane lipoprotein-sorting protein
MIFRRIGAILVLLPLAAFFTFKAQSLQAVYPMLDKDAPQFRSIDASLRRLIHTAVINDDAVDDGSIKVKRDKGRDTRVLINITGADARTVWVDATTVNMYIPKLNTVQVFEIGDRRSLLDEYLLLGFGASSAELQAAYDISYGGNENIAGHPADHLVLIPKSKEQLKQIKRADLWIGTDGIPVQQKVTTSSTGDFTMFTWSNPKVNGSMPDGAVKYSLPRGVKVEHPGR